MQKIKLDYMFTKEARKLAFSRMMRKPLAVIEGIVTCSIVGCGHPESEPDLKYMIYSAHDDQISNMMMWLENSSVAMDYVLYAS